MVGKPSCQLYGEGPASGQIAKKEMIQLLAVDLDGTLLDSNRQIPEANAKAVAEAVEKGVLVVPASGRIGPSIRPFSDQLGLDGTMICCNGAHVLLAGEEILHAGLSSQITRTIVEYAFEAEEHLNLYCRDKLYFTGDPVWGEVYLSRVRTVEPIVVPKQEALQLLPTKAILVADPASMPRHFEYFSRALPQDQVELVFSEPDYLEVLPAGFSKATGLRALSERLGISREHVAAIGDFYNDVEMIRWAGLGAAMANAPEEVRQAADVVTKSNDECGVALFIKDYLLIP